MAELSRALAQRLATRLREAGHIVYLVGGCVRDRLLGLPVKDYDLATSAPPARLIELFPRALEVGAHFGVVLVREEEAEVQVATFRTDHAYRDGRRPEAVTYETDPRQDVLRRDFTINALLENPFTGEVIDLVNGLADLRDHRLRAIGDPAQRFQEDRLRLLRAIRFAARLAFDIESTTWDALIRQASAIATVSAERIRDELSRILTEGGARRGLELLDASSLLEILLPEVARMKGVPQPPEFHPEGDVWTHTLLLLENLPPASPLPLALAALFHDVGKPPTFAVTDRIRFNGHASEGARLTRRILERLKYPGTVIETVASLVQNHMRFLDLPNMGAAARKRFFRIPHFDEQLELYRLDLLGGLRPPDAYEEVRRMRASYEEHDLRPPPLITGEDLIELGYNPGPLFKRILDAVEEQQLEGKLATRDEALGFVLGNFDRAG
jgi:putative nucleotidyltransferase with HDIG domain